MHDDEPRFYFLDPAFGSSRPDPELDDETRGMLDEFVSIGFIIEVCHPLFEEGPNLQWTVNAFRPDETSGPGERGQTIREALTKLHERLSCDFTNAARFESPHA